MVLCIDLVSVNLCGGIYVQSLQVFSFCHDKEYPVVCVFMGAIFTSDRVTEEWL